MNIVKRKCCSDGFVMLDIIINAIPSLAAANCGILSLLNEEIISILEDKSIN